jgi:hypothetical protein
LACGPQGKGEGTDACSRRSAEQPLLASKRLTKGGKGTQDKGLEEEVKTPKKCKKKDAKNFLNIFVY